jgi:hypothetical protein
MRQKAVWFLALTCTAVVIAACNILIQAVGAQPATKSYLTGGCDTPQTPFCDALMAPSPNWTGQPDLTRQRSALCEPSARLPRAEIFLLVASCRKCLNFLGKEREPRTIWSRVQADRLRCARRPLILPAIDGASLHFNKIEEVMASGAKPDHHLTSSTPARRFFLSSRRSISRK